MQNILTINVISIETRMKASLFDSLFIGTSDVKF